MLIVYINSIPLHHFTISGLSFEKVGEGSGLEDCPVGEVLAAQPREPEFSPQNHVERPDMVVAATVKLGGRDRWSHRSHCQPARPPC